MYQDIDHDLIFVLPVSVHALNFSFCSVFRLKICFIFHLFLHVLSSFIIYTLNKAATFGMTVVFKKGQIFKKDVTPRVYIKDVWFNTYAYLGGWKFVFFVYSQTEFGLFVHVSVH